MIKIIKQKICNFVSDKRFTEILTGSVWALGAKILSTLFALVASIIIARSYGADVLGIVAVINSFLMLAAIFTVMGTGTSILRLIPEHLAQYSPTSAFKVYRKTQYMVILVSLVAGILFYINADFIAAKIFSKPHLSFYFALASVCIVFRSLMDVNTQAVRGLRLIKVFAFMQVLPQGFNLFLLIFLGALWSTKQVPVLALLCGFAVTGVLGWFIMEYSFKKRMQPQDRIQNVQPRMILSISLPMLMTATMNFAIGQTGVIMLGMFRSNEEVGYYAVAVKLATLTGFILQAVNSMAAPKFSELYHSGMMDELFYVAKKSTKLIFWTTTPILLGLILLGIPILNVVFGKDFTIAYPALMILCLGQFAHTISGSTGIFMNMTGNQNPFRNIVLIAAIFNIVLNLLLIPNHGLYGAAFAGSATLVGWNIATLCYMKLKYGKTTGYFPTMSIKK